MPSDGRAFVKDARACDGSRVPDDQHRGPHPEDAGYFVDARWPMIREAARDLAWLLGRGYTMSASLALVGNRFQLEDRVRTALMRGVCSDAALADRHRRRVARADAVWLDGFNVLMTVEAALAGGTLLLARDGCIRNLAPIHGSYRRVAETEPAIAAIGKVLDDLGVRRAVWFLDVPVSNSGRLKTLLRETAEAAGWSWHIELVPDVDRQLKLIPETIATSDGVILDACGAWLDLARAVIMHVMPEARLIDAFS